MIKKILLILITCSLSYGQVFSNALNGTDLIQQGITTFDISRYPNISPEEKKKLEAKEKERIRRGEEIKEQRRKAAEEERKRIAAEEERKRIAAEEEERRKIAAEEERIRKENTELIQATSGTGFAVSHDGHIITNHHVIDACQEVKVRYKSDDILAKLIAFDTVNDLAILKIDTKPISVLPISYNNAEILQEIYVAGFPFGERFSTSIKMTKGIISSLAGLDNNYSNIQIDAALQPGNSGGPVFDDKGNVVGVAVAKIDLEYAIKELGVVPENTNFGIKSSVVKNFLESNSIGNLASPLNYKASMTSLGKSVTDATYYVSCMMTMAQIRKVQDQKVIYSELIK